MDYLRWAKTHGRVRYDLTSSGVPSLERRSLEISSASVALEVVGTYGHPALIEAISARYGCQAGGVVPVPGASTGNFIAMAIGAGRGGCIAVERPCYQPFTRVASFLGIKVIPVNRNRDSCFGVSLDDVDQTLRGGARAIVVSNLHNPSGQLLTAAFIRKLADHCREHGATLIVDEVYLDAVHIVGGGACWTAAAVSDNVIAVSSLTKVYGLGGLRVGWIITNPELAERAREVMDLLSIDNPAPSASLAVNAFAGINRLEERFRRFYHEGQPVFRRWLCGQTLAAGYESRGALFEYVRLPLGVSADSLADALAKRYETQVVPGCFFGLADHIRVSLALPPDDLREALDRVGQALEELASGDGCA